MLVRIFRSTSLMPPVLLAGLALLAAVISYPVFPAAVPANGLPGYDTLVHGLGLLPDWCTLAASSMLLLVQAIHLNLILNKHGVLFKISWLPALLYLLLASMLLPVFGFNPAMVVNSLLIFVLDKLFGLYKNPSSWGMIFDAGLLLSLAALIYLPTLLLSFYFFIALALIRPWSWREWMIGLLGLAAPLFFAAVYLFMVDGLQSYLQEVFLPGIRIELSSGQQFQRVQLVSVVLIGLIFLMAVFNAQSNYYRNVAKTRVSQQLLLILVPFSLCTLLVAPDAAVYRVGLASIPLAVYLAYFFLAGRNMWIMEACMLLLLAAWTANRLMPF